MTPLTLARKKNSKGTLSVISPFGAGGKFDGHDSREYAIASHAADAAVPMYRTLMTLQEMADYLRVTRSTIHRLLKHNQIPAFRIGRHWRFNLEEVETWCSSRALSGGLKRDPTADG